MKLDKWPEEVEVDGWKWELRWTINTQTPAPDGIFYSRPTYHKLEKLHVPPTHRQIMQHLLRDGVVVEEAGDAKFHYRIGAKSELEVATSPFLNTWTPACLSLGPARSSKFSLIWE